LESSLYLPVKRFLEKLGFEVKGEVCGCDLVALDGGSPTAVVIGELKLTFTLELVLQAVDRTAACDEIWLAVRASRRGRGRECDPRVKKLCRFLGYGLLSVFASGKVEVLVEPVPWRPRRDAKRRSRIVDEHRRRLGDPAAGGSTRRPIMTAYRQQALACAAALAHAPGRPRDLKASMPDAPKILLNNVYGWFVRVERGIYTLSEGGKGGPGAVEGPSSCAGRFRLGGGVDHAAACSSTTIASQRHRIHAINGRVSLSTHEVELLAVRRAGLVGRRHALDGRTRRLPRRRYQHDARNRLRHGLRCLLGFLLALGSGGHRQQVCANGKRADAEHDISRVPTRAGGSGRPQHAHGFAHSLYRQQIRLNISPENAARGRRTAKSRMRCPDDTAATKVARCSRPLGTNLRRWERADPTPPLSGTLADQPTCPASAFRPAEKQAPGPGRR
jgi:hypothetical protein